MGLMKKMFRRQKGVSAQEKGGLSSATRSQPTADDSSESISPPSTASPSSSRSMYADDSASSLADPSPSGVMEWNHLYQNGYDDATVSGAQSIGTSAFFSDEGDARSRGLTSDDDSFFQQQSLVSTSMDPVHIIAPAGKLGIALDTPDSGSPVIYHVKETSPLFGKVLENDRLVAIDDEDVSYLTAVKISKILNRKSSNTVRKLTMLRPVV